MSLGLNTIPWFRVVNPAESSFRAIYSTVCLRGCRWEEAGPLETRSKHEMVFTGLMTVLSWHPDTTLGWEWVDLQNLDTVLRQKLVKVLGQHDGHLSSCRWVLCYTGCCCSCTLGSLAFMDLVFYGCVSGLIIQLALPSGLYNSYIERWLSDLIMEAKA